MSGFSGSFYPEIGGNVARSVRTWFGVRSAFPLPFLRLTARCTRYAGRPILPFGGFANVRAAREIWLSCDRLIRNYACFILTRNADCKKTRYESGPFSNSKCLRCTSSPQKPQTNEA